VGSNPEAVAGNGAFWVDAKAEAVAGTGALCEEDARRSPKLELDLVSDPIGSGEQPTKPTNNATTANRLPKRDARHMCQFRAKERDYPWSAAEELTG
jgi:hypothetical protein